MKNLFGLPKMSEVFKEKTQKYDSLLGSITPSRTSLFDDLIVHKTVEAEKALTANEVLLMHQETERKRHVEFVRKNYMDNQGALLRAIRGMLDEFAPHQLLLQSKSYQELEALLEKIEAFPPERNQLHEDALRAQIEAMIKQAELTQMQKVTYGKPKSP